MSEVNALGISILVFQLHSLLRKLFYGDIALSANGKAAKVASLQSIG